MRAADSDRQYVADRLRDALNEGRLDLSEYDERLRDAYAARTYGELDRLLGDLPPVVPASRAQVTPTAAPVPTAPPSAPRRAIAPWLLALWGGWLTTSIVCIVIWALTGSSGFPWPVWVAGPWGAVLLGRTLTALASGDPAGYARARQNGERQRRQERWERRRQRWERRGHP